MINFCGRKFKEMLNVGPYSETGDEQENEKKRKAHVLSVVLETQTGTLYFAFVDEFGEHVDHLILKYFYTQNADKHPPQIKASIDKDRDNLKKFIEKNKPELIVVMSNSLEARTIKNKMGNIREDFKVLKSQGKNVKTPWVEYGDHIIPQLYAKTYK